MVGGASSVTVEADAQPTASASRSFDTASVAAGGEVVVTIAATGYGSLGAVTETLPAGFSYVSSSLTDEGEVTEVDDVTVRFTLQGADKTFTYTVTASSTAGPHDFSGTLRDSDKVDSVVGGASSVTVSGPRATRAFSSTNVRPSGQVTVTITAAGYGSLGAVTETLPAGSATYPAVSPMRVRSPRSMTLLSGSPSRERTRPSPIPLTPPARWAPMISPVS